MPHYLSLTEQVVLITGAAGGIGSAIAQHLAQQSPGIRLVLTDCHQEQLEQCATFCQKAGADVLAISADLTNSEQLKGVPEAAVEHFGQVNALINNAAYSQSGPIETMSTATIQQHFQVNVLAPIALIQALIPVMRLQGGGRIINISSIAGRLAFPFEGIYGASKFALEGLSDSLRMELAHFNIRVIVIEPGAVLTKALRANTKALIKFILEPPNTPYSAAALRLSHLFEEIERQAWSPEQVAQIIQKALTSDRPRSRYIAASAIVKLSLLMMTKVCPTQAVDKFRQRLYGINSISKKWEKC